MIADLAAAVADIRRMWARDRDILMAIGGLFFFLPQFALLLLVTPAPKRVADATDQAAALEWLQAMVDWYQANGLGLIAATAMALVGALTLLVLYLETGRPDVRGALGSALRLLPSYLLTALLVTIPIWFGLALFIVPGIYAQARLLLAGPALVAERGIGAVAAVRRSVELTRGRGVVLSALACFILFGGNILAAPFLALGTTLDGAPIANPVAAALLDAGASLAMAVTALVSILIRIALYRRLTQPNRGI